MLRTDSGRRNQKFPTENVQLDFSIYQETVITRLVLKETSCCLCNSFFLPIVGRLKGENWHKLTHMHMQKESPGTGTDKNENLI